MAETKVVPPTATPTHKPFAAVLEKAAGKDKANLQKQLDALAALPVPAHAQTWQQLVATLAGLAPHALQTVGKEAVRFFVADGRYKLQVYAIEDKRDGHIAVYLPDVLEQAIKKKIVAPTKSPTEFALPGSRGETIVIDSLNGDNTMDAPAHFKFMIGLGRKALRVTVAAAGRPAQVAAAEALCQLAAPPIAKPA